MSVRIGSSFSRAFTSVPKTTTSPKVNSRSPSIYFQQQLGLGKGKSCQFLHEKLIINERFPKKPCILYATSEDREFYSELNLDASEQETYHPPVEDVSSSNTLSAYAEVAGGKSGLITFYGHPYPEKDKVLVTIPMKNKSSVLWFAGPAVLVASFIFPSLYLRRILSTIFEDSLLTDFLILFFTEALFYCGVAVFFFLIDRLRMPIKLVSSATGSNDTPFWGHKISSVAVLVLSLIIPMVTMGFVWPWTGPAASATLAPYLVGIVVQFAFEQYARYRKSPSRPVVPIIFQVYRLHQLNRAAQLVTALSFTVRGAELTPQNLAINGSLSTILNVLQVLGVICIWSLSSFIMRLLPSAVMPE